MESLSDDCLSQTLTEKAYGKQWADHTVPSFEPLSSFSLSSSAESTKKPEARGQISCRGLGPVEGAAWRDRWTM